MFQIDKLMICPLLALLQTSMYHPYGASPCGSLKHKAMEGQLLHLVEYTAVLAEAISPC